MASYFGDDIAYSRLPSFSYGDETFEWGPYCAAYSMVVKKQNNSSKRKAVMDFASFVSKQDNLLPAMGNSAYHSPYEDSNPSISRYPWLYEPLYQAKDHMGYPPSWFYAFGTLIDAIKEDYGRLNDESLTNALNRYHEQVMNTYLSLLPGFSGKGRASEKSR